VKIGLHVLTVTEDCPIAGGKLPLVVISHGRGGEFLGHHERNLTLSSRVLLSKKGPTPALRRGRTDPPGRNSAVPAHDASLALTLATCVGCHRPPLGVGTPRRVSSSAAARTLSVATCPKTLASSLARSSAARA
jgi:hypothetical protein